MAITPAYNKRGTMGNKMLLFHFPITMIQLRLHLALSKLKTKAVKPFYKFCVIGAFGHSKTDSVSPLYDPLYDMV